MKKYEFWETDAEIPENISHVRLNKKDINLSIDVFFCI